MISNNLSAAVRVFCLFVLLSFVTLSVGREIRCVLRQQVSQCVLNVKVTWLIKCFLAH